MARMAEEFRGLEKIIEEVSRASRDQSSAIQEVNSGVGEMGRVVHQNAAIAQETSSASEEMNTQAIRLNEVVIDLVATVRGKRYRSHQNPQGRSGEAASRSAKSPSSMGNCRQIRGWRVP